ncbi:MAG: hypothetical protein ACOYB5_02075 [Patescibacteria group bacterium]|jgi:hypothetical protein
MRLKYLFFPIAVIIAICIFIAYAWPEITKIRMQNEKILESNGKLQDVIAKNDAIKKMSSMINENQSDKQLIEDYLPNKRVEEKIISSLNFLATDSGVALVSLNLKSVDAAPSKQARTTAQTISDANKVKNTLEIPDDSNNSRSSTSTSNDESVKYTKVILAASGEYDKIKIFLDQIQRMQLFNNIKSISITKPQTTEGSSTSLIADVTVDFGHLEMTQSDSRTAFNFSNEFDDETISALKEYISNKSTSVLSNEQAQGKANPFLP